MRMLAILVGTGWLATVAGAQQDVQRGAEQDQPAAAAPASAASAITLRALEGRNTLNLKEARGRYVAVHYLPAVNGAAPEQAAAVRDMEAGGLGLAGLEQAYVTPSDGAWTAELGEARSALFLDADGALGRELKLDTTIPATVVFDEEGRELFRWVGTSGQDHQAFASFSARFTKLTEAPALAEYNIPKDTHLALQGYDAVAYFGPGKPMEGKQQFTSVYQGVKYQFASAENRSKFNQEPAKYCPTYGGWCATAMGAKGQKVEVDPTNFKIKDGRLHLFYKDFFSNALTDWNKHEKEWEPAADKNWTKLTKEEPRSREPMLRGAGSASEKK